MSLEVLSSTSRVHSAKVLTYRIRVAMFVLGLAINGSLISSQTKTYLWTGQVLSELVHFHLYWITEDDYEKLICYFGYICLIGLQPHQIVHGDRNLMFCIFRLAILKYFYAKKSKIFVQLLTKRYKNKSIIVFLWANLFDIIQTVMLIWICIYLEHTSNTKDRRYHHNSCIVACQWVQFCHQLNDCRSLIMSHTLWGKR